MRVHGQLASSELASDLELPWCTPSEYPHVGIAGRYCHSIQYRSSCRSSAVMTMPAQLMKTYVVCCTLRRCIAMCTMCLGSLTAELGRVCQTHMMNI